MSQINNSLIFRNTILLYGRTAFSMFISLFTSRITLQALGIEDYGISNAVGGVIAMFSFVSGSLSSSISRFITYEIGHGDSNKLKKIFATALNIQLIIGLLIIFFGETLGTWFLNTQMNIPSNRMVAANWVFQFAILSFFVGLTQTPYTACIIAYEKMSVFAWFGIVDSLLRLLIVYLLYISPCDKLITLSLLSFATSLLLRIAQRVYCKRNFEECVYRFIFDRNLLKDMSGFIGWSFFSNIVWVLNLHGVNILINIFFGVAFNAARGLANTVQGLVTRFCGDFTTALNPQITKSYAAGEIDEMNSLICRGARLSFFLMFTLSLPLMFEAYQVLYLWLGQVPYKTVSFFRLSIVSSLITIIGNTGLTACMATGRIKWYSIILGSIALFVFPLTWITYKIKMPVESAYYIYIIIYLILDIVRLFIMRYLWGFSIWMFIKETIIPIIAVTVVAIILPWIMFILMSPSLSRFFIVTILSFLCSIISIIQIGLSNKERAVLIKKIKNNIWVWIVKQKCHI